MEPKWMKTLKEYVEAFTVALVLALFIRTFVVQAFKIPSGSMLETLQIGDHLLVNKFLYGLKMPFTDKIMVQVSDPKFQDVIVFEYPEDPDKDFIKRIIGLPGDTIEIKDKEVYRNGEKLTEPYIQHVESQDYPSLENVLHRSIPQDEYFKVKDPHLFKRDNMPPITVPADHYFVMGDNRDSSHDSRWWGFVGRSAIKGKAFILYWSWDGPLNIRWNRIGKLVH
jgi:signal peptidase I